MSTFPLPLHRDGRKAGISDGFHTHADVAAGRAKRQHRGCDVMFRKPAASPPDHPYSSKWYEIPRDYDVPVLAVETGRIVAAGMLDTGGWVALDLGKGRMVAYHHLKAVLVTVGPVVGEGTPLGVVGGSPIGYGLVHLHFDLAERCKAPRLDRLNGTFVDPAKYLAGCKHVGLPEGY